MVLDKSKVYAYDSRQIQMGDSFICLPKGQRYIEDALRRGATEVIHMTRDDFARNAHNYFDYPTQKVCLIGITGTNGKTSVSYFTQQLLTAFGANVLVIGTINSSLTTPESWDTLSRINDHIEQGGTHVILEVSSHGIDQKRVFDFDFNVKCLTNITQDHLDYHPTFEHYKNTKMGFMAQSPGIAIYSDDIPEISVDEITQLTGQFHRKNVASAVAICNALGIHRKTIAPLLKTLVPPKGRFQAINMGQSFTVIVDFAHTPDALETVLLDAQLIKSKKLAKLRVVFGCGGDRDTTKRKKMGAIAAQLSDAVYLTADNSRSELTSQIIQDIKAGVQAGAAIVLKYSDRYMAISKAISDARPGDVVLIAGKGHETYQVSHGFSYHFSDADTAMAELIQQKKCHNMPSWVLNQPEATADVLFVSKKIPPTVSPSLGAFQRVLMVPTRTKVAEYLSKIKAKKLVVFETGDRIPMSHWLQWVLCENTGVMTCDIGDAESFLHDLVGLTLIEQTDAPVIIRINPYHHVRLQSLISMIAPDHIIVGDVYHPHHYIEPMIQKRIMDAYDRCDSSCTIWCSADMTDMTDHLLLQKTSEVRVIDSANWTDYLMRVSADILMAISHYKNGLDRLFQSYLLAAQWYYKVTLDALPGHIYVVSWTNDALDLKQKINFFKRNAMSICHVVFPSEFCDQIHEELMQEVAHDSHQHLQLFAAFKEPTENNTQKGFIPDAHLFWMDRGQRLEDMMGEL